jgi:GT2 family glycosyltransferase
MEEFLSSNLKIVIEYLFEGKIGKSYALNSALNHITGDLIAFTDDDVTVDKNWIREMINAAKRYHAYSCFGGKVIALYPEKMPKWLDINGSMKFLRSVFVDRDDGDLEVEYGINTVSKSPGGVNMFLRREAIAKNGLFRTDLGPTGKLLGFSEDTEYCQRLIEKGERFMYIPTAIVYHQVYKERLCKKYLLTWQYRCGVSEVRRNKGYGNVEKIFGVPKYLLKKFIDHSVGWLLSLQSKKKFYHRLRLYYTAGEVVEHLKMWF